MDRFYYYFGVAPIRLFKPKKETLEKFLSDHDNGSFDHIHFQTNCTNRACMMDAYVFNYPSTEAASRATSMLQIHREEHPHCNLLPNVSTEIDPVIVLPLLISGRFTLTSINEEGAPQAIFPVSLDVDTKEEVRHHMFYGVVEPYLEGRGFVVKREMSKFQQGFGEYSKYGNSYIDLAFYHSTKFYTNTEVKAAGIVTRRTALTSTTMECVAGGIELKVKSRGDAGQVEAESFLLASNIAAVALSKQCCILEKVTTYIALIDMSICKATLYIMEFQFHNDGGSVNLTTSTPGPLKDIVAKLFNHLD